MPKWTPERIWDNQDVYIIGGGRSLKHFDWSLLKDKFTIGCNDAYKHGADICKICIFGDTKWFVKHMSDLSRYKGVVFTNSLKVAKQQKRLGWLWTLPREASGLHKNALGWNFNTGAAAFNLALLLGAKRIFLLGFDMHLIDGRNNWHDNTVDKPDKEIYKRHLRGFARIAKDMKKDYPEVEVLNVTDDSSLNEFPKVGVEKFWAGRKAG